MTDTVRICRTCSVEREIARHKGDWTMGFCPICEEYHALYEVVQGQPNQGDKRASDLATALSEPLECPECGSSNQDPSEMGSWRWNGESWEHKCGGLDPQCGHFPIGRVLVAARISYLRSVQGNSDAEF